jgi:SAM-dependent methyltransferase
MHVSVITPTHDCRWLGDAWRSLQAQTHPHWNWLLMPNGGAEIPAEIARDARVWVLPAAEGEEGKVGALKRRLADLAPGPVVLELDHDDILTPDCLAEVVRAVGEDEDAADRPVFFYSDFVQFWPDGRSHTFDAKYGWESYPTMVDGKEYRAMRAFPPDASSLRQIYYAPNHVRAWTKAAYKLAGGHDPSLPVCDDFDLVCKLYLAGVEFCHIPRPLYLYRERAGKVSPRNSYREFRADGTLERIHARLQATSTWKLIHEWCRRARLPRYDLGGRIGCPAGYTSVDLHGAQVNCDLTAGFPFPDDSVGIFRAADFLEHIPREKVIFVMNEIWRCLAPGGWLISRTPSTGGYGAYCDPTHASFWNLLSFRYYTDRRYAAYVPEIRCRFQAARVWECYPSKWHEDQKLFYVYADLCALKGQRQAGEQLI